MKLNAEALQVALAEAGMSAEDITSAIAKAKPVKRAWRKYNIYITPTQAEKIAEAYPDVRLILANPGKPS